MDFLADNNFLNNQLKQFSTENTIIISSNKLLLDNDFRNFNITQFCEYILRKAPIFSPPKTISKIYANYLIQHIIQSTFRSNPALFNLTHSKSFSKELYELFGKFIICQFKPNELTKILTETTLEQEDLNRLNCIIETYKKYIEKLTQINYIDSRFLPEYTKQILTEYPQYFENINNKIKNIIIEAETEYNQNEYSLLQMFCEPKRINFWKKFDNAFADIIKDRYLEKIKINKEKSLQTKLITFNSIRDEAWFIASEIIKQVEEQNQKYSDFNIITTSNEDKTIFQEIFNSANIPCTHQQSSQNYTSFIVKLINILSICNSMLALENETALTNIDFIYDEINLNFQNLISLSLENQFIKDKFLDILENSNEKSLITCVQTNLNILNPNDIAIMSENLKIINNCFELYKQNKLTQIIINVAKTEKIQDELFKTNLAQLIKKIHSVSLFSTEIGLPILHFTDIIAIIQTEQHQENENVKNCIHFTNIKNAEAITTKNLFISGLTEKSLPPQIAHTQFISFEANNILSKKLKSQNNEFDFLIIPSETQVQLSAKHLISALKSSENITITTHTYEDKKQTQPSIFFQLLASEFPQNTSISAYTALEQTINEQTICLNTTSTQTPIIKEDEILYLSSSAINMFKKCPQKYYYQNLIGLQETSNFATTYGTTVHCIFENFNKHYLNNYTKQTLIDLGNILFNSTNEPEQAIINHFKEHDIERVRAADLLSLAEMKDNFFNALDELEKNGFFLSPPTNVTSEIKFEFSLKEIPKVIFIGKIDAIYERNGKYTIVDFKTGNDHNIKKDCQLPLYYLACQHSTQLKQFAQNITSVDYQYIRAKNQYGGCKLESMQIDELTEILPDIIQDINENVVQEIRKKTFFEAKKQNYCHNTCTYACLCTNDNEENYD